MPLDGLWDAKAAYDQIIDALLLSLHAPCEQWSRLLPGLPSATRRYRAALTAASQAVPEELATAVDSFPDTDFKFMPEETGSLYSMQAESLVKDTAALLTVLSGHRRRQGLYRAYSGRALP